MIPVRWPGAVLCAVTLGLARPVRADGGRFIPIFDADIRGGITKLNRGPFTGAGIGTVIAMPAYKVSDSGMVMPIYLFDGSVYNRTVDIAETDSVLFVSRQTHTASLGYRQGLTDRIDSKLAAEGTYALNRETPSERIGKGLYDYFDLGGRGTVTWKLDQEGRPAPLNASLRVYERRYPNYESLASKNSAFLNAVNSDAAAEIGDKEKRPKDYLGFEAGANQGRWLGAAGRIRLGYTAALKLYHDSYVHTTQDQLTGTKRTDLLQRVETGIALGDPSGFGYGADLDGRFNDSNSTHFEAAKSQINHPYIPHFNQFGSAALSPWAGWTLPWGTELHPRVRITGTTMALFYTDRNRQDAQGTYINGKERDFEYGLDVRGWYPIRKWLSATAGVTGLIDRSNNHYELFTKYSYEVMVASAGVSLSF